jgi:pimeloyl-ACP methyl ester carboxylesterase
MALQSKTDSQVSWIVDEIAIQATLTVPSGKEPFPAVVFVAGSGPTDRNWNSPLIPGTNGSAALLARALTDLGFVTLRYDKRASGLHRKENAMRLMGKISMQAHLDELAGGVGLLAGRDDVNSRHIFVLANSEGCIHAMNYQIQATDSPFAGLVLTAPPARPVGIVARGQVAAQLNSVPDGDKWLAAYDAAMADFAAGHAANINQDLPEWLRNVLNALTNPVNQPFARELWVTDPASLLDKIKTPVLVVIGKKDLQVDWQADGGVIETLAKTHDNITINYPDNANHVLKHEPRAKSQLSAAEAANAYSADDSVLDSGALTAITAWLVAHLPAQS